MSTENTPTDPRQALTTAYVIWGALLGGQIFLAVVVLVINSITGPFIEGGMIPGAVAGFSALILLSGVTMGLFIRSQTYKRHWVGDAVQPAGFIQGNIILWGMIESASFVGLIAAMIGGSLFPYGLPAAAALGLLIAMKPNGRAMQPTPNPDAASAPPAEASSPSDR